MRFEKHDFVPFPNNSSSSSVTILNRGQPLAECFIVFGIPKQIKENHCEKTELVIPQILDSYPQIGSTFIKTLNLVLFVIYSLVLFMQSKRLPAYNR